MLKNNRHSVHVLLIGVAQLLAAGFALATGEEFRGGPDHRGVYAGEGPHGDIGIVWKFPTGGPVRSSPAVTDNVVYIGSEDGYLYALDRLDGHLLWRFRAGGPISGSPAVDAGTVVVSSADGSLYAVDRRSGEQVWHIRTGAGKPNRWGFDYIVSSPVLDDGVVYIGGDDGRVRAIVASNGQVKWQSESLGGMIRCSPAVSRGHVIACTSAGILVALDQQTGARQWAFESVGAKLDLSAFGFDRQSIYSSPATDGNVVVVGSRDGFAYAVGLADGSEKWRVDYQVSWVIGSAALSGSSALVGTSDGHFFHSLDLATGKENWRYPTPGRVQSSGAVAGATVYVGGQDGSMFALDAATGREAWRYWVGAAVTSSPVPRDGQLFFGADDGYVYALSGEGTDPGPIHRAVFWNDARPIAFKDGVALRDYCQGAGYEVLDNGKLVAFLHDRIADQAPSLIVFAMDRLPLEVGLDPDADSLLRQYLEAGGRVVWSGIPPYIAIVDPATGKTKGVDMARAKTFTGVSFDPFGFDDVAARPTEQGRRHGLEGWWMSYGAVAANGIDHVLATDDLGRAVTWEQHVGKSGSFVMIAGGQHLTIDLAQVLRLAEGRY